MFQTRDPSVRVLQVGAASNYKKYYANSHVVCIGLLQYAVYHTYGYKLRLLYFSITDSTQKKVQIFQKARALKSRDSVAGIVTGLRTRRPVNRGSIPGRKKRDFSPLQTVQTGPGT
jgi:hypothetical protein